MRDLMAASGVVLRVASHFSATHRLAANSACATKRSRARMHCCGGEYCR